jgi:phage terminase small subunit
MRAAGLTPAKDGERRDRFALEYVTNGLNGTRAAIAAGCPSAGARVAAVRMLREPEVRKAILARILECLDQRRRVFVKAYTRPWTTDDPRMISASAAARIAGCPRPGSRVAAYRLVREPLVNCFITTVLDVWNENFERECEERERQKQLVSEARLQANLAAVRRSLTGGRSRGCRR